MVLAQRGGGHGRTDDFHQLKRRFDLLFLPPAADGGGDARGVTLFAICIKDALQFLFGPGIHQLPGRKTPGAVHAHVQRRVGHVAEAPLCIVQLGGGDPQIEEHPVRQLDALLVQDLPDAVKIAFYQGDPVPEGPEPLPGGSQSVLVPVDADQAARGEALCDLIRMAAAPQGPVHIDALGADLEAGDTFRQQHRRMAELAHKPSSS